MDHHRPVDLLQPVVVLVEPLNFVGGFRLMLHGNLILVDSKTSPSGVIIATLKRAGEVKTGSF
jgi:hypothetical protein